MAMFNSASSFTPTAPNMSSGFSSLRPKTSRIAYWSMPNFRPSRSFSSCTVSLSFTFTSCLVLFPRLTVTRNSFGGACEVDINAESAPAMHPLPPLRPMASDDARGVEAATAAIASPLEPRLQVAGGLLDDVPGVGGVMFDDLTGKLSPEGAAEGLTGAAPRGRPIALPICTAWRAAERWNDRRVEPK
eukprot:CAMPEP_0181243942 /NCGR_PEP_ID=MMETSP1096-20121128/42568_1 /TAXON_ID=156174 ORGANISM="Chrysochromulina ericina, Strain CCMP281" /NCGR_SAMPLE_ID=MMETSP1096 /ASSEMBLY_ACC=CAM_ASM_000453 /LENGTH=187 /DNA_ID=CAMNT_0023340403 /DNA_START=307 /DNA_END=867 /DNA_ORIENTATION=-